MTADQLMRALHRKYPAMRAERVTLTQEALRSLVRLAHKEGAKGDEPYNFMSDLMSKLGKEPK